MRCKQIVLNYFKRHGFRYALGVAFVVTSTVLTAILPNLVGQTVDAIKNASNAGDLSQLSLVRQLALKMVLCAFGSFIARFIWRYLIHGFTRSVELNLRQTLFTHLQKLSADFYVKNNTGDLITRSILDTQVIRMMLGMGLVGIIDVTTIIAVTIPYMISTANLKLTMMAVIPLPFLLFALVKLRTIMRRRFMVVQAAVSDISSKVQENMTGIRVIKAFAQEESENLHFEELSKAKWKAEMSMVRISSIINPISSLAFGIVFSIFLFVGGRMVIDGNLTLGEFTAFNTYIAYLMGPINRVSRIIQIWQRGIVSMQRLDKIFASSPTVTDKNADSSITTLKPISVKVKLDSFIYPGTDTPVLQNIRFSLAPGEVLAIMGPTGSGKTTLINMFMRIWNAPKASVFLSNHAVERIPLDVLRNSIAYVPQDTFLFSDSIENNIIFYDENITPEDAQTAAQVAVIHDNIMEFEKQYQTAVGERGMTLSGGQKQRISIARALARKPSLLLLDDCLSAVDAETEHAILSNLREYIRHCTTILVTHRIAAAGLADRILILSEDGHQLALGTHDELMASSPEYRQLVELAGQSKEELKNA
jgi:ATP-binding cassette subfamily B multidrug efflux pump